ncbi:MAG: MMPL family transporter, partial [Lachnospiraceae bacterium]|nr:MMPL family transporter [Lachnospiraceae bacterium]
LPDSLDFVTANDKLQDEFNMASTHMVLADSKLSHKHAKAMLEEISDVDGVKYAVGLDSLLGDSVPEEFLPDSIRDLLKSDQWQLMLISSEYYVGSDEVNDQVTHINNIIKKYDPSAMLIGEAPCTKDLVTVTDKDFRIVTIISVAAIFMIIALVTKSVSIPVILVAVIEFAIFVNLGIPFYTKTSLPFIAPICISTIQLGATVDYAILMTTRYKKERVNGGNRKDSVITALSTSIPSVMVSAIGFFAATFGVAVYSDLDIISSMCGLMARGAVISMLCVVLILPAFLYAFDPVIIHSTLGMKAVCEREKHDHGRHGNKHHTPEPVPAH